MSSILYVNSLGIYTITALKFYQKINRMLKKMEEADQLKNLTQTNQNLFNQLINHSIGLGGTEGLNKHLPND